MRGHASLDKAKAGATKQPEVNPLGEDFWSGRESAMDDAYPGTLAIFTLSATEGNSRSFKAIRGIKYAFWCRDKRAASLPLARLVTFTYARFVTTNLPIRTAFAFSI